MDLSGNKKIFVVIPAYNETAKIAEVVMSVKEIITNIIVVDDASEDQTAEIAERAGADVLEHLINRGQGAALKTGIDYAVKCGADIIVTFDADGQHKAEEMMRLVDPVAKGEVDAVLGSRFLGNLPQNMPMTRRLILKGGIMFTRFFSRINITDTHNGFRALSKHAAQTIRIRQDRMAHASEILDEIAYHKLKFCEVPVTISYSKYSLQKGQSSLNSIKIVFKFILGKIMR